MDETAPTNFQLIDPREQEINKTTCKLNLQALKELKWTPPLYVLLYNQIRYYEDYGKLKLGYSIAGKEALAEQFGVSVKSIDSAYNTLTNKLHLGNWVICDKKVFKNVSKIWVSNVRQERDSKMELLSQQESTSLPAGEHISPSRRVATPELTGTENKYKYNKKNTSFVASAPNENPPFFLPVNKTNENLAGTAIDLKSHDDTKRTYALVNELVDLMGSSVKGKKSVLKKIVEARLKDGYSEVELKQVARWSTTQQDDFYKNPYSLFSEAGFVGALTKMDSDKPKLTTMRTV